MSYNTKAYTLARLTREVSALSNVQTTSVAKLASALSPRSGRFSVKIEVLNQFVSNQLANVIAGNGAAKQLGSSPRARLLRALRNRARNGNAFSF